VTTTIIDDILNGNFGSDLYAEENKTTILGSTKQAFHKGTVVGDKRHFAKDTGHVGTHSYTCLVDGN